MPVRNIGPKGQIVIPKRMIESLGLKPGAEVVLELRDQEIIIKKPQFSGSYADYFITTSAPKLKKKINIKELLAKKLKKEMPYIDANVFIYPIYMKIREQKTDFSRKSQFFLLSKMPLYDKMQIPNDIAK